MLRKTLDIAELQIAAEKFCKRENGLYRSELFGITDGKAVGTFVEHLFQEYLEERYDMAVGSSAIGLDLPSVNTGISKLLQSNSHNRVVLSRIASKRFMGLVITLLCSFIRK